MVNSPISSGNKPCCHHSPSKRRSGIVGNGWFARISLIALQKFSMTFLKDLRTHLHALRTLLRKKLVKHGNFFFLRVNDVFCHHTPVRILAVFKLARAMVMADC